MTGAPSTKQREMMKRELYVVMVGVVDATAPKTSAYLCEAIGRDNNRVYVDMPNGLEPQWVKLEFAAPFAGNGRMRDKWRDQIAAALHENGFEPEQTTLFTLDVMSEFVTLIDAEDCPLNIVGLCLSLSRGTAKGPQTVYVKPRVPENLAIYQDAETGKHTVVAKYQEMHGVPCYRPYKAERGVHLHFERAEDAVRAAREAMAS
jgi:hypothetical protein